MYFCFLRKALVLPKVTFLFLKKFEIDLQSIYGGLQRPFGFLNYNY
jgi:hypothetical protein